MNILARRLVCWGAPVLALSLFAGPAAADLKELDLALNPPGGVVTRPVRPGSYSFVLKNTVHGTTYLTSVERELVPIAALVSPFAAPTPPKGTTESVRSPCEELISGFESTVKAEKSEGGVKGVVDKTLKDPRLKECKPEERIRLDDLIEELTTRKVDDTYDLLQGELLRVVVEGDDAKTWTFVYTTGERGHWDTIYGFTFVPDRDERHHTQAVAGSTEFEIVEDHGREDLDFVPSFMFRWTRSLRPGADKPERSERLVDWSSGFLAGLGFDSNHPVVFAGWGWTYAENVTLALGLAIHERQRLDGKYDEGDRVKENLTADQLSKPTFAPNVFAGVAFRFGSNVHAERAKALKDAATAREAAQKAAAEKEAAAKKAADAAAKKKDLCEKKAEEERIEALEKCAVTDSLCVSAADAARDTAKAQCAVDAL
jgi:hypothetical protein